MPYIDPVYISRHHIGPPPKEAIRVGMRCLACGSSGSFPAHVAAAALAEIQRDGCPECGKGPIEPDEPIPTDPEP